jgi:hypothetical protein
MRIGRLSCRCCPSWSSTTARFLSSFDASTLLDTVANPGLLLAGEDGGVNGSAAPWDALIRDGRAALERDGCFLLHDFLSPAGTEALASEARSVSHLAHVSSTTHDYFLESPAPSSSSSSSSSSSTATTPPFGRTDVGSVACDHLPDGSLLRALYEWPPLLRLVREVTTATTTATATEEEEGEGSDPPSVQQLHRIADPLGACTLNVFRPGMAHHWHFDEAPVTVTLMLQPAGEGGAFEVLRGASRQNLRQQQQQQQQQQQRQQRQQQQFGRSGCSLLANDKDDEDVSALPFSPGTLSIFRGRESLHRVAPVLGDRERLVAVFCFSPEPDFVNTEETRRRFWGRAG